MARSDATTKGEEGTTPWKPLIKTLRSIPFICYLIWEFTESNFGTFVLPNTAFGMLGALVPSLLVDCPTRGSPLVILRRLPIVVTFNWYNVLIFDLANQRLPESIREDSLNKPWRPIPTGKVTAEQTRRAMLVAIPIALACNYSLGVWEQGLLIQLLIWLYNDLMGGDELVRDLIISIAYGMFNSGSLEIAVGGGNKGCISQQGVAWTAVISGVILTTMQVQDLKDQAGDRTRGRRTIALFFGDRVSRITIAISVFFWTCVCTIFWDLGLAGLLLPGLSGITVILRVLLMRSPKEDSRTWKWWCVWTVTLYTLPLTAVPLMMGGFSVGNIGCE